MDESTKPPKAVEPAVAPTATAAVPAPPAAPKVAAKGPGNPAVRYLRRWVADTTTTIATVVAFVLLVFGLWGVFIAIPLLKNPTAVNYQSQNVGGFLLLGVVFLAGLGSLTVIGTPSYWPLRAKWFGAAAAAASAVAIVGLSGYSTIIETQPLPTPGLVDYIATAEPNASGVMVEGLYPITTTTPDRQKEGLDMFLAGFASVVALTFGLYAVNHTNESGALVKAADGGAASPPTDPPSGSADGGA